jgi:predicted MPP superfamily phosphohydrolase
MAQTHKIMTRFGGDGVTSHPRTAAFLYVNPGLGTFGLPVRLGMPPEVTVLTLRAVE